VPDQLLTLLKFCLLALIYLFFLRVLRAVWAEIKPSNAQQANRGPVGPPTTVPARAPAGTAAPTASPSGGRRRGRNRDPGPAQLVVVEPPALAGRSFPVTDQVTIGRAANCQICVDDTFVSQLHARVYPYDGQVVIEDLGSTNGTFLNRNRLSGALAMNRGDRVQIGNTVLELS
jgi:pSer/pThr/pTyr-binding forkhead associated (FHA) protein